MPRCRHN